MTNKKVIIANKCRMGFTDAAVKFSTRSGKRRFFNLPHSQIVNRKMTSIQYNDVHQEPAVEYEITNWIFERIKDDLETMKKHDCIILPNNGLLASIPSQVTYKPGNFTIEKFNELCKLEPKHDKVFSAQMNALTLLDCDDETFTALYLSENIFFLGTNSTWKKVDQKAKELGILTE